MIATLSLILSTGKILWDARHDRDARRHSFFQHFIDGARTHNWKFIEHRNVPGVWPNIDTIAGMDEKGLAQRAVLLDHLNILWSMYLHRSVLYREDMESVTLWAKSWFKESESQLRLVLDEGDIYPLDFLSWLDREVFGARLRPLMGDTLLDRIQKFEAGRQTWLSSVLR